MSDILEIGTEWRWACPPSPYASGTSFRLWTYRVTGHSKVMIDNREDMTSTIEPLSVEEFPADGYAIVAGRMLPIPPREVVDYVADDLKALRRMIDDGYLKPAFRMV